MLGWDSTVGLDRRARPRTVAALALTSWRLQRWARCLSRYQRRKGAPCGRPPVPVRCRSRRPWSPAFFPPPEVFPSRPNHVSLKQQTCKRNDNGSSRQRSSNGSRVCGSAQHRRPILVRCHASPELSLGGHFSWPESSLVGAHWLGRRVRTAPMGLMERAPRCARIPTLRS